MMFNKRLKKARRDDGVTLPELLISVTLTGLLLTTLSMVATVTLRNMDNNEGRTNNARSEQNVGVWMPTDLASAEDVNTLAPTMPCGPGAPTTEVAPACLAGLDLSGSNTLLLVWHGSKNTPTKPTRRRPWRRSTGICSSATNTSSIG